MKKYRGKNLFFSPISVTAFLLFLMPTLIHANLQNMGAWYMYYWKVSPKESHFGLRGDIQVHSHLEPSEVDKLMFRGGLSYRPGNSRGHLFNGVCASIYFFPTRSYG